jgi:hypothetical protein
MTALPRRAFCEILLRLLAVCVLSAPLAFYAHSLLEGWAALFASTGVFLAIFTISVYGVALDASEKQFIKNLTYKLTTKFKKRSA